MINKLYGDGIHDDLPAIQEMLDSGMPCVYLPMPEKTIQSLHRFASIQIRS